MGDDYDKFVRLWCEKWGEVLLFDFSNDFIV